MTVHWKGGLAQLVCILYNKDLHRHKVSLLMLLSVSKCSTEGFAYFHVNVALYYLMDKA